MFLPKYFSNEDNTTIHRNPIFVCKFYSVLFLRSDKLSSVAKYYTPSSRIASTSSWMLSRLLEAGVLHPLLLQPGCPWFGMILTWSQFWFKDFPLEPAPLRGGHKTYMVLCEWKHMYHTQTVFPDFRHVINGNTLIYIKIFLFPCFWKAF